MKHIAALVSPGRVLLVLLGVLWAAAAIWLLDPGGAFSIFLLVTCIANFWVALQADAFGRYRVARIGIIAGNIFGVILVGFFGVSTTFSGRMDVS